MVVVVFVLAAVAVMVTARMAPRLDLKLADGSILSVQQVTFGKRASLRPEGWLEHWKTKLLGALPANWTARFIKSQQAMRSGWSSGSMITHTNVDALQVWLNRRDPATGKFKNVEVDYGELLDEHGCVFPNSASGGADYGLLPPRTGGFQGQISSIVWLSFEDFPRQQKQFRLRVYDWQKNFITEITLPNPAWPPKPRADWKVEPLPVTKRAGAVTYTLTGVNFKTNAQGPLHYRGPVGIEPVFEVQVDGKPSAGWEIMDQDLTDSSGNVAPKVLPLSLFLCPQEPAWKLSVKIHVPESSQPGSRPAWTLKGVEIPDPGKFTTLGSSGEFGGVSVTVVAVAGPGDVAYSNDVLVSSSPVDSAFRGMTSRASAGRGYQTQNIRSGSPQIALKVGEIPKDEWVTVRAVDAQGRQYEPRGSGAGLRSRGSGGGGGQRIAGGINRGLTYLHFDLPPEVKKVDLTLTLEGADTQEFIFKPPNPVSR